MPQDDSLRSLSPLELVRDIYFGLGSPIGNANGWIHFLTEGDMFGFTNDKQKEALFALKKEIDAITEVNHRILDWFYYHQESMGEE